MLNYNVQLFWIFWTRQLMIQRRLLHFAILQFSSLSQRLSTRPEQLPKCFPSLDVAHFRIFRQKRRLPRGKKGIPQAPQKKRNGDVEKTFGERGENAENESSNGSCRDGKESPKAAQCGCFGPGLRPRHASDGAATPVARPYPSKKKKGAGNERGVDSAGF